ncbi:MAG: helix-turn-helix transcriptional regulator [Salinigranum sp.]
MNTAFRTATYLVVATILVASTVAGFAAGASGAAGATPAPALGFQPDGILMQVSVAPNGSATWSIEYRVRLSDENVTKAFESLKRDIERNETAYSASFARRMRATAGAAENATGRNMSVQNVTVTANRRQLPREYGVVTYRFRWTGFASTSGDELRVGDALSGMFLDKETTLMIRWPSAYRQVSVSPTPDDRRDGAVVWNGPSDFVGDEPRLVLSSAPAPTTAGTATGTGAGGNAGGGAKGGQSGGSMLPLAVGVVAVAAAAAGFVAFRRRGGTLDAGPLAGSDGSGPAGDAGRTAVDDAPSGAGDAADAGADQELPEELLSNEERVLRLVRERGGRLKQQEVAEALEWTDAKTSQVVRQMREEGQLEGFRLGRENVLTLPDDDEESS